MTSITNSLPALQPTTHQEPQLNLERLPESLLHKIFLFTGPVATSTVQLLSREMHATVNNLTPFQLSEIISDDLKLDKSPKYKSNVSQDLIERLGPNFANELCQKLAHKYDLKFLSNVTPVLIEKSEENKLEKAKNTTSKYLLRLLASDEAIAIRCAVAQNTITSAGALETLAGDSSDSVRQAVAFNPNTSVGSLDSLATDSNGLIRRAVALNPVTPTAILENFAQNMFADDPGDTIRWAVAKHPKTPVDTLKSLAKNSMIVIRKTVAENAKTPVDTLKGLAKDPNCMVRLAVASNPNTPAETLESLANDRHQSILAAVARHPNTLSITLAIVLPLIASRLIRHI